MRNKMKIITTICITMLLVFSLTGCGGDEIEINSWDNKDVKQNNAITYNPDENEDTKETETTEETNDDEENKESIENNESTESSENGSMFKFSSTNSDTDDESNTNSVENNDSEDGENQDKETEE